MKSYPVIVSLFFCIPYSAFPTTPYTNLTDSPLSDSSFISNKTNTAQHPTGDTIQSHTSLKPYTRLIFQKSEHIKAAPGTKSVLFNKTGQKLYAMNLEGMSIYEFQRDSRLLQREFKFKPTVGTGWDYETNKTMPSFEEKPVEACLSNDDKLLWVSLHNAASIVPIPTDPVIGYRQDTSQSTVKQKKIYIEYAGSASKDSIQVPAIATGLTPKIIARTADSKHLLVSNWHSHSVSVLAIDSVAYPYAKTVSTLPVSAIPRGIVVDDERKKSYVAIMGGALITVINNDTWKKESDIPVASNPRHIVLADSGRLLVSYNKLGRIACIDPITRKTLYTAKTAAQPRTIVLSKNNKFLFVTCYSSDKVEVFKTNNNRFIRVASLPCKGHPVGVDIFEDDDKLEAWVCSYNNGTINIFSFEKK
ncbi:MULTISPECIES: YncE family protein [Niastella]|uniref:YncE family protein n=1 Tax=Niastella soli TaxID=2821487 RepID=A0ABS3YYM9_9BACT|nr:YncE family protein [Niastella soli]MBO9203025.1 YncE family protein [Niastella soli]